MFPLVPLGDVVRFIGGSQPPKSSFIYEKKVGYVRLLQIRDYKSENNLTYILESSTRKFCVKDDVMIGRYGPPVFQILRGLSGAYNVALMKAEPSEKINIDFLYYFLKQEKLFNLIDGLSQRTAGQSGVDMGALKKYPMMLFPLVEQQKIAAILGAADSLRQKDRQLIDHYTSLSQSLFLAMFGDPVTNPMGWDIKAADSVIDLLTGYAFKSKDYSSNEDDIHLCGGLIITPSGIDWSKAKFWSRSNLDGIERYRLKQDDIVMAMDRPWVSSGFKIHKITKSDKESLLVQRTARIRGKNVNQDFLYFLFKHPAFEKQARTTETTVPHISPKDIRNYELIVPPLDLQNQFADRVKLIESQKQQAQASLEKSEALFNSLLHHAYTGALTESKAA
jgi:type I restriction enzyme S subunit